MAFPLERVNDPLTQHNFERIASRLVDTGGRSIRMRFGATTVTFSAAVQSNVVTVDHGLGVVPVTILASMTGDTVSNAIVVIVSASPPTDTQFQVRATDVAGLARTGTETVYWLALG